MSLAARLLAADEPTPTHGPLDDFWYRAFGATNATNSGINITPDLALQVSAVFACVKVLAETLGMLPLIVYERLSETAKTRATGEPTYRLLHDRPNEWQTAYEFKELLTGWAALHGNGYAEKVFNPITGDVEQLIPIHPALVEVEMLPTRRLRYLVRQQDGTRKPYTQDEIFHLRGLSFDGISGVMISRQGREAIALARASEAFGARYFANDTTVGVVFEHPNQLSDQAYERLKKDFAGQFGGVHNAWKPKILEEGMKLNRLQANGKEAQLIEARAHQVIEICRFFRMPPHKIAHLLQATFSNIEHQALEFVTDTIQPWAVRWEQAASRDLIRDDETYFAEFLLTALLRGDSKARGEYFRERFHIGTLSRNEIRALENENPIPGGDTYYVNAAVVPLDENGRPIPQEKVTLPADPGTQPGAVSDPGDSEDDAEGAAEARAAARARASFRVLVADAAERIARAETRELEKRADKATADFERFTRWAEEYYDGHLAYVARTLTPLVEAWALLGGAAVSVPAIAEALVADGKREVLAPAFPVGAQHVIDARPDRVAQRLADAFHLGTLQEPAHA